MASTSSSTRAEMSKRKLESSPYNSLKTRNSNALWSSSLMSTAGATGNGMGNGATTSSRSRTTSNSKMSQDGQEVHGQGVVTPEQVESLSRRVRELEQEVRQLREELKAIKSGGADL